MFSRTARFSGTAAAAPGTAAWRVSVWSGVAFAIGSAIAFLFLQSFLANDIQTRADSWLTGELGVLSDVARRTPENELHNAVVREVAELASREVPQDADTSADAMNRAVFFLQTSPAGVLKLHTGAGEAQAVAGAVAKAGVRPSHPGEVIIPGFAIPFRVAQSTMSSGDRLYLALSTSYELRVLRRLRIEFALIWIAINLLGTSIVYVSTRRMLHRIEVISETAAGVGRSNLSSRVPVAHRDDEIARLSSTLNDMLDRIEAAVQQLHDMSDSLAHDLRSPLTSLRGRLELGLMSENAESREEAIVLSIEELDRLSGLLSTSLDVSEAGADALRIRREPVDLVQVTRSLAELYEPAFQQAGLALTLHAPERLLVQADTALLQRVISNLLDNELKHILPGSEVTVRIEPRDSGGVMSVTDSGTGFPEEILPHLFTRYVKGARSAGHGLGLAFVSAVVRSHGGTLVAQNVAGGGAQISFELPLLVEEASLADLASAKA